MDSTVKKRLEARHNAYESESIRGNPRRRRLPVRRGRAAPASRGDARASLSPGEPEAPAAGEILLFH